MINHVIICYSPDDCAYYLEDQNPDNWRVSKQLYATDQEALEAFTNEEVEWEEI